MLARLSPALFSHPIWVHFVEANGSISPDKLLDILKPVPQLLEEGDISSAGQILLLSAPLYKRGSDLASALDNTQQALKLAELNHLSHLALFAAWGRSAIYACLKDYRHAVESLEWLQSRLSEENDWVLIAYVELAKRALLSEEQESGIPEIINWLYCWGDPPALIGRSDLAKINSKPKERRLTRGRNHKVESRSRWQSFWKTLKRIFKGELHLEWVERPNRTNYPSPKNDHSHSLRIEPLNTAEQKPFLAELITQPDSPPFDSRPPIIAAPLELFVEKRAPKGNLQIQSNQNFSINVYCLGQLCVYRDVELINNWSSRKAQLIFKYLITHRGQAISKDVLMNIFWPDAESEAARRNLHQAIYALRQTLRDKNSNFQPVLFENDCYRFNSELNLWLDYEEFEQHSRAGQAFEQNHQAEEAMTEYGIAEGLYRDHFLVEDLYEDWAQPHRETLWQTYLFISYRLAHYYLARSEHAAAIALCRRILAFDNSQEEAHLNLMKCYLSQGQRHLAINQYKLCFQALKEDLDIPPSAETRALYQQITKG